jgi:hypothetical protein
VIRYPARRAVNSRYSHAIAPPQRRGPDDTSRGWNVWGERLGATMPLPGTYVREHVSLGYACTKDSAQGRTVDAGHVVT